MQMETSQIIILIILIVIGIILFVVFLVELVNIPKPLIVPFADGTTIKIKSLANNLYLRPVPCSLVTTCNNAYVRAFCDNQPNGSIISAVGQATDPLTNWQLCQYSALSDQGEAKYLVFSESNQGTSVMTIFDGTLFLSPSNGVCTELKNKQLTCSPTDTFYNYFSFILNEKVLSTTNTTSGSYKIKASCGPFIGTSGQGATSLPANICPPVILEQKAIGVQIGCPAPDVDPRCSLSYLFEIEVQ